MNENEVKDGGPSITLTPEQLSAVEQILNWLKLDKQQEFKLGGYAGTGKTTVVKFLLEALAKEKLSVVVAAFTGKAVHVLNKKGIRFAQTLHSLMYNLDGVHGGRMEWVRKSKLEAEPDVVIVDEASMVSTELYNDLKSFETKLLFIGDPGQLEPVGDNPELMVYPDFVLQTIHRQAAESPIIQLANGIRTGAASLRNGVGVIEPSIRALLAKRNENNSLIIRDKQLSRRDYLWADQVICAKNLTRQNLNHAFRKAFDRTCAHILPGEKLIVLRNNPQFGVFNGLILFVIEVQKTGNDFWVCRCKSEIGQEYIIPIWQAPFEEPNKKPEMVPKDLVYCDYGYVITCHKSQGSEWDKVLVIDEWMPAKVWDMKKWRYTAITRAAKELVYCV